MTDRRIERWNPFAHPDKPLRWRKPRRVFVAGDLFAPEHTDTDIGRAFDVMRACWAVRRGHAFHVGTIHAGRLRDFCLRLRFDGLANDGHGRVWLADAPTDRGGWPLMGGTPGSYPLPNVILYARCSTQADLDERVPVLLDTPAAKRGVDLDPLTGAVSLGQTGSSVPGPWALPVYKEAGTMTEWAVQPSKRDDGSIDRGVSYHRPGRGWVKWSAKPCIDHVRIAGETGAGARPLDVEWVRSVVAQCRAAGVPCRVERLTRWAFDSRGIKGFSGTVDPKARRHQPFRSTNASDPAEWPEDIRAREWPS